MPWACSFSQASTAKVWFFRGSRMPMMMSRFQGGVGFTGLPEAPAKLVMEVATKLEGLGVRLRGQALANIPVIRLGLIWKY